MNITHSKTIKMDAQETKTSHSQLFDLYLGLLLFLISKCFEFLDLQINLWLLLPIVLLESEPQQTKFLPESFRLTTDEFLSFGQQNLRKQLSANIVLRTL